MTTVEEGSFTVLTVPLPLLLGVRVFSVAVVLLSGSFEPVKAEAKEAIGETKLVVVSSFLKSEVKGEMKELDRSELDSNEVVEEGLGILLLLTAPVVVGVVVVAVFTVGFERLEFVAEKTPFDLLPLLLLVLFSLVLSFLLL